MEKYREAMLTTIDNPYNPFTEFDNWYMYDVEHGYNSCGYLMRIANITDAMSSYEAIAEINRAIDEIIKYDFMKIRKKVYLDD